MRFNGILVQQLTRSWLYYLTGGMISSSAPKINCTDHLMEYVHDQTSHILVYTGRQVIINVFNSLNPKTKIHWQGVMIVMKRLFCGVFSWWTLTVNKCTNPQGDASSYNAESHMSHDIRLQTMRNVRPAKTQISLRIRAVWSEPLLVASIFYGC